MPQTKWFLEGSEGAQIVVYNGIKKDVVYWRSQSLPTELAEKIRALDCSQATIVGLKTSHAVQAACQILCDANIAVQVVRQAIADDQMERGAAVLEHLIPIYADVIDIENFLNETVVNYAVLQQADEPSPVRYISDCGRGGHFGIYAAHLLRKEDAWIEWPTQNWYADFSRSFNCPLGQKVVDFCDEPKFSRVCVFLKGREHLDEKEKLLQLRCDEVCMPESFLVHNRSWIGDSTPSEEDLAQVGPWFVKEVNKNGGRAIQICHTLQDALALTEARVTYVVQKHIPDPLLAGGHKCHIKLYNLLISREDVWDLYTYRDGFWSKSPNPWSADDLSLETQVTVKRTHRLQVGEGPVPHWPEAGSWSHVYSKCQSAVKNMVHGAIAEGKLQHRPAGQTQFEIFSADFMVDKQQQVWLIEFNFTPVLFDPLYFNESNLTTAGLKRYHAAYLKDGDKAVINDQRMIQDVVHTVFGGAKVPIDSLWDHVHRL